MNSYPAKVNRTVTYRTADGEVLPAVITAVINETTADLRVGHHGETYLAKVRRSGDRGAANVNWNDRWSVG